MLHRRPGSRSYSSHLNHSSRDAPDSYALAEDLTSLRIEVVEPVKVISLLLKPVSALARSTSDDDSVGNVLKTSRAGMVSPTAYVRPGNEVFSRLLRSETSGRCERIVRAIRIQVP